MLPADRLKSVERALEQTFNTTDVLEITLLTGGLSASVVYKIRIEEQYYVLKLDMPQTAVEDEVPACMQIAAEGGIAPIVFYLDRAEGISLTAFIKSEPLHSAIKPTEVLLSHLAKTIKAIHELPLFSKESNMLDTVDGLIAEFKASGMLEEVFVKECFEYYQIIRQNYPWQDDDKVSSHNDLNPNNMMFGEGKIWVIDWDAAFKNDRYVDLAITANFYVNDEQQEQLFLESYFGDGLNDYHRARFFIMRQICRMVYAMLMFRLAYHSKPAGTVHDQEIESVRIKAVKELLGHGKLSIAGYEGQFLFGKALLNEALYSMRTARFHQSITLMEKTLS